MEITYKVGKNNHFVFACDICGVHKKPKNGKEICRKSTISSFGKIPVFNLCKKCGTDKFTKKVFK